MRVPPQTLYIAALPLVSWFLLFCAKQVVADFVLQPRWMAIGKDLTVGWARPLVLHCAIHGFCTTLCLVVLKPALWPLGFADFLVHLLIDRTKGLFVSRYGLTTEDRPFWLLLGLDQALHHLTGLALALAAAGALQAV